MRVCPWNLENLFTPGDGAGPASMSEFDAMVDSLAATITAMDPDVLAVQEVGDPDALQEVMDLSPSGIRNHLALNKPIYARTAAYGHFGRKAGRDGAFSWEKTDLAKELKKAIKG